jgi:hypothetical protein
VNSTKASSLNTTHQSSDCDFDCTVIGAASNRAWHWPKRASAIVAAFVGMITITFVGCAGYNLGNQYLFRNDIRTVHVPIFESDSNRRFLAQRLTEAVVKQVEQGTPLTITDPSVSNSFLRGRLIRDQKNTVTENQFDDARAVRTSFRVEIDWVDRAGVPLMPRRSVIIDQGVEFIPEGGQSLATAQQTLIDRIAREVVGQMEMPW